MANYSRTPPLQKLLGKLRNIVLLPPPFDSPRRSWENAAAREIQLELDLCARRDIRSRHRS
jgi:hypothetical protein